MEWGYRAIVKLLLEINKVNVNLRDKDGWTLLLWVVKRILLLQAPEERY